MQLVDLLILLLEAHASVLQSLSIRIGEENLVNLLNTFQDEVNESLCTRVAAANGGSWAYEALEQAIARIVGDMGLSPDLEFHLCSYSYYRAWIENSIELGECLPINSQQARALTEQAISWALLWLNQYPISGHQAVAISAPTVKDTVMFSWIRFRNSIYRKLNQNPLALVRFHPNYSRTCEGSHSEKG